MILAADTPELRRKGYSAPPPYTRPVARVLCEAIVCRGWNAGRSVWLVLQGYTTFLVTLS